MSRLRIALIVIAIAAARSRRSRVRDRHDAPVRGALRTCSELFTVANRPDLADRDRLDAAAPSLHPTIPERAPARRGPRGRARQHPANLNKNFKAWREGRNVLICTSNRVGPVYRFVHEDGRWQFDGLVGILQPSGRVMRASDLPPQPID